MEDTLELNAKVKTLTLHKLIKNRWKNNYSVENILEWADQGYFGLYFKPGRIGVYKDKWRTYHTVTDHLRTLLKGYPGISTAEANYYLQLKDAFIRFCRDKRFLLKPKSGYARLATEIETAISRICENGSVRNFSECNVITGKEYNNVFGFVFMQPDSGKPKSCVAPAYLFPNGRIGEEDLFVFTDQIENFEKKYFPKRHGKSKKTAETGAKVNSTVMEKSPSVPENVYRKNGECYEIIFNHQQLPPIPKIKAKGLAYILSLVKSPYEEFSARDLFVNATPSPELGIIADEDLQHLNQSDEANQSDVLSDDTALQQYRGRIEKLKLQIEDKNARGDLEDAEKLENDMQDLLEHIAESTFKNNRKRFRSDSEKCRQSVTKAISRAIAVIATQSPELGKHLTYSIKTGYTCTYSPRGETEWQVTT